MNISEIHNCYGCGVCATVCSKNIIQISLNQKGFYEPQIQDAEKCTNCGLCTEVCSFLHKDVSLKPTEVHSYAAWSNEPGILYKCSSGGIGFELGRSLLGQGYKVCGVKYNADKQRAEHYIATTIEELIPSIGSKYIQSYTIEGFNAMNRRYKYLVTGTPCQIDSFRRSIRKFRIEENFILMDFFCHSVPSILAWNKYIQIIEKQTGKVTHASWRNKFTSWHDSWAIAIAGEKGFFSSRLSQGDLFYKLFLGDYCCNPACQKDCKYKYDASSADIRIGDLWGNTYKENEDGVSALITFTAKGYEAVKSLTNCTLIEHPFEVVAEGQMRKNAKRAHLAKVVSWMLHAEKNFSLKQWKLLFKAENILHLPTKILKKYYFKK